MLWFPVPGAPRCGVHSITVITPVSSDRPNECAGHRAFAKVCADVMGRPLWTDRRLTLWIAGLVPRPVGGWQEEPRFPLEVADLGEALVDAGEPQVGDLVELTQPLQHRLTDLLGAGLAAARSDRFLELGRQLLHLLDGDRPVLGRRLHAGHDLGPIERLPVARTFDHRQAGFFHALEGGEAPAARQALPSPADGTAVVGEPRVDDLVVEARARRASHGA